MIAREPKREIASLVNDLAEQMPLLDARRAGAEMYGAPRLSITYLFDPKETALSRILSDLFDPRGSHGQGALFLNALLFHAELPRLGFAAVDAVRVKREVTTAQGRRIDIVIEHPDFIVGIENKPWAGQQPDQLSDYHQELGRRASGKPFRLVFISDQEEKTAVGDVLKLPYFADDNEFSLHVLLRNCAPQVRAQRVTQFVNDLADWIDTRFGKGETYMSRQFDEPYIQAVQAEFDHPQKRRAVATVLLAGDSLWTRIIDDIGEFLLAELRQKLGDVVGPKLSLTAALSEEGRPWGIRRKSWPENCSVGLESEEDEAAAVFFGVFAPDPERNAAGEACSARPLLNALRQKVPGGKPSPRWVWWRSFEPVEWDYAFLARLIVRSGDIASAPEMQALASSLAQLSEQVDNLIKGSQPR